MNPLAFLVRGRSVDLVAMTAARALEENLGLGDRLVDLRRDEIFVIEDIAGGSVSQWSAALTRQAHWYNPNKHRYAVSTLNPGAIAAASEGSPWPSPWLTGLVESDRPDLIERISRGPIGAMDALRSWCAIEVETGRNPFAVNLAVWDREQILSPLPSGHWPEPDTNVLQLVLWTMVLAADDARTAVEWAEEAAVVRTRHRGLLIHPHMNGWARIADAWPVEEGAVR